MKLNNTQINALASKFHDEIEEIINEKNKIDKEKQLEQYRPNYQKAINLLKENKWLDSVKIKLTKHSTIDVKLKDSFEDFTDSWAFRTMLKTKYKVPELQDIKNDIIIATIDTSSVEEIIEQLKEKYS
jgi:hypothetical protein